MWFHLYSVRRSIFYSIRKMDSGLFLPIKWFDIISSYDSTCESWQLNLEWSSFILYCGSTYIVLNFVRTLRLLNLDRACSPLGQGLIYIKRDTHPTYEKRGESEEIIIPSCRFSLISCSFPWVVIWSWQSFVDVMGNGSKSLTSYIREREEKVKKPSSPPVVFPFLQLSLNCNMMMTILCRFFGQWK